MHRRTHNMQRSCWLLELPEATTEKPYTGTIHAHATNAAGAPPPQKKILINPNANPMQPNATPDKMYNLLPVVNYLS